MNQMSHQREQMKGLALKESKSTARFQSSYAQQQSISRPIVCPSTEMAVESHDLHGL